MVVECWRRRRCALPIVVIDYFKDVVEGVGDTQSVGRGKSTLMSRMDAREDPCVGRRPGRGHNALAAPEGLVLVSILCGGRARASGSS